MRLRRHAILYLMDIETAYYGYTHQNIQYSVIALSVVLLLVCSKSFTNYKRIPKISFFNPSYWFNNYFFSGSSWNRAFTLVGEGYIIGGVTGIIILFFVIGLLIRMLMRFTSKGVWQYAIYIYGVISVISSFRSTLGDMLVGIIRVPLLSILMFYFVKKLFIKSYSNTD